MFILSIQSWWSSLGQAEQIFWFIAIVFTMLLIIQIILSFIGLDSDLDVDDGGSDGGYAIDADFTLFSVRSIIAFFTFFGWVGALSLKAGLSLLISSILAFIAGLACMTMVAYLLFKMSQLKERGNLVIENALNQNGEVYLKIPASKKGTGKVHVEIQGKIVELDAMTDGNEISTGSKITIHEVLENNVLLVGKI